ncbi:hypothetical protein C8J48_3749 [Desmospora activa DSM 45169]|uniref:Uncharacterized protein n=1 Tax=Desmospora activa DSM 45169 TaxID=1121389 RepID=A0A2T4YYU6_9BACL|nr:hypothetical protein C8J48_3749 [Desmospora activa DSM 45169]
MTPDKADITEERTKDGTNEKNTDSAGISAGQDYYLVGYKEVPIDGLMARQRG